MKPSKKQIALAEEKSQQIDGRIQGFYTRKGRPYVIISVGTWPHAINYCYWLKNNPLKALC